jgi:hypothetical protein
VTAFKSEHGDTFVSDKGNVVIDKLTKLSTELTNAQLTLLSANAEFEQVQSIKDTPGLWQYIKDNPLPNDTDVAAAASSERGSRSTGIDGGPFSAERGK